MINVYLTDDHTLLVESLCATLQHSEQIRINRTFPTLDACRKALATALPDVLLLDLSMPDGDGVQFCREMTQTYPTLKIIVLTVHDECSLVKRALESGIRGYLLKSVSCQQLEEAIVQVHRGETCLCREIAALLRKQSANLIHLTARERDILTLLVEGCNSEEIARRLFISVLTVKWHRRNMLAKFGVQNTGMLISKAVKERLV